MVDELTSLHLIGPKTKILLSKLGITTPANLLYHLPRKYLDFIHLTKISKVQPSTHVSVQGHLVSFKNIYTRAHKNIQKAVISDGSGQMDIIWFNQPYLEKNYRLNQTYCFAGQTHLFQDKITLVAPFSTQNSGKIIPIYPETKGLTSTTFRKIFTTNLPQLLTNLHDPLPLQTQKQFHLLSKTLALSQVHQPESFSLLKSAQFRIGLDETLSLLAKSRLLSQQGAALTVPTPFLLTPTISSRLDKFIAGLPFTLTASQQTVWKEIVDDLLSPTPTNRLLQGDVGSGKTIIAILCCLLAYYNRQTSLLMAPTEILAQQHYTTIKQLLPRLSLTLISSTTPTTSIPQTGIIIATHAAIHRRRYLPPNIGLLIIDEQHKFGVAQRNFLSDLPHPPHCLTMTATPIPRTVSLSLLGHLQISSLRQLPLNRLPISTFFVPQHKVPACYSWLRQHLLTTQQQGFVVCPFIDDSDTQGEVKSAKGEYENLQKNIFPDLKIGLIHGQMKSEDRQKVLHQFQEKQLHILVTTPIIEVGVDFPNATSIIIHSAERFGLAQLHQLRGRVGRSGLQSYCYLMSESVDRQAISRLEYISHHHDGQKIAEYDLCTRGPGEIFSTTQHGFVSADSNQPTPLELIKTAQSVLDHLISTQPQFPLSSLITSSTHLWNYTISN